LWDSIASDSKQVGFPEHHKSILEEWLQTLDEDTANGKSRDKVRGKK
jgi:hypothetical protein